METPDLSILITSLFHEYIRYKAEYLSENPSQNGLALLRRDGGSACPGVPESKGENNQSYI